MYNSSKKSASSNFWRPRLLPIFMALVGLMIFDRSWHLIQGTRQQSLMANQVHAEDNKADQEPRREINTGKKSDASPSKLESSPEEKKETTPKAKEDNKKEPSHKSDKLSESEADILSTFDPMQMSESQIKLLLSLSSRRKQIEKKEDKLEQDSAVLELIEKRIEEQLKKLENLKGSIESSVKKYDEQENKKVLELVKIYEGMKPAAAASIFNELPMSVLIPVIQQMNKRKVAPILAQMEVKKVKNLTTKLAQKTPIDIEDNPPSESPTPTATSEPASDAQAKPPIAQAPNSEAITPTSAPLASKG